MNLTEIQCTIHKCYHPEYIFNVKQDSRGSVYLQGSYSEKDTVTGKLEIQRTRRWFLNYEMTKSEIVQTAFKCIMTSMEHRAREWFHFMGETVFSPHFDIDALVTICREKRFAHRG